MKHDRRTQAAIDAGEPSWAELPATREEAKALAATRFFTGRPCDSGHISTRQTQGYFCHACNKEKYRPKHHSRTDIQERRRVKAREQYRDNPPKLEDRQGMRVVVSERRTTNLNATPRWLTDEHRKQIERIYAKAAHLTKKTGIPHHVDHIIPLQHPLVCGLHIPANLQFLTASENSSKNNRFDGTRENESWRSDLSI